MKMQTQITPTFPEQMMKNKMDRPAPMATAAKKRKKIDTFPDEGKKSRGPTLTVLPNPTCLPTCGDSKTNEDGQLLVRLEHLLVTIRSRQVRSLVFQAVIALHIRRHTEVSLRDLAEAVSVTRANVTSLADNLEELGLAVRNSCDLDRRRTLISLTPTGASFVQWVEEVMLSSPNDVS